MITIMSTTQGKGHGAEAVLCALLRAWPTDEEPLRIVAPQGSMVLDQARDGRFDVVPLCAARDALIDNTRAVLSTLSDSAGAWVCHAWSARAFEFAWWLSRRSGTKSSGTLHDHPCAVFHGALRQRIMRWSANRMGGLVTVSRAVAEMAERCGYRVPLQVVHNGLRDVTRRTQPADHVRVGFLGMYARWKGVQLVADWIEALLNGRDMQWCLYGEPIPQMRSRFERLAAKHPGKVLINGGRTTEEIFNEIDVLVHASVEFDPLPTVLIEAARAGIPCIASSVGGVSEIVIHGETGFLFSPNQPRSGFEFIDRLVSDAALRKKMGQRARERFEAEFRVELMVEGYRRFWAALRQRS